MNLTKIVFRGQVDGIFGDSVSALSTEATPNLRQVAALEMTPLGLVVTRIDGERRLVPGHMCSTGDLEPLYRKVEHTDPEPQATQPQAPQRGPRQKAR